MKPRIPEGSLRQKEIRVAPSICCTMPLPHRRSGRKNRVAARSDEAGGIKRFAIITQRNDERARSCWRLPGIVSRFHKANVRAFVLWSQNVPSLAVMRHRPLIDRRKLRVFVRQIEIRTIPAQLNRLIGTTTRKPMLTNPARLEVRRPDSVSFKNSTSIRRKFPARRMYHTSR